MRKPKRVKFFSEGVHVHDSPERCIATQSPRSDAPKTSEFAYFRKFKGADVHDHSRSQHKENEKLNRSKITNLITDTSAAFGKSIEPSYKDLKISVSGDRANPADHNNIFLSPRISKYSVLDQRRQNDKSEKMSSLIYENVTPVGQSLFSSPSHEATTNSGNEYNEKGIFSAKRHSLRKLAAQTLFSEAEILHPKRFDFVTALMSRLFPKDKNSDSSKEDAYSSSKSLVLHKSNNLDKGLQLPRKRDCDLEVPKSKSGRSNKIIRSEWDSFVSGYPIPNHGTESRAHCLLDRQHLKSWSTYDTSNKSSPFIFEGLEEHNPREELHRSLLEWNQGWRIDKLDSSIINVNYAGLPTSLKINQKRFTDNVINIKRPLLDSNNFLGVDSLLYARDFGPEIDDMECALSEPRLSTYSNIDQKEFTNNVINFKGPSLLFPNHVLELGSLPYVRDFGTDFDAVECALAEPGLPALEIEQKRYTDTVINAKGPNLLFTNHFLELDSLPNAWDFRSGFDDVKCPLTEPGCFALTLPKCIAPREDDRNEENTRCNQNILLDRKFECDSWKKWLSASDFSTKDYCNRMAFPHCQYPQDDSSLLCSFSRLPGKSIITPFSEGAFFNRNLLPSSHEYSSLGAFINRPLLLDRVSCDKPDRKIYFGDGDEV